jgi:hypothetical protein
MSDGDGCGAIAGALLIGLAIGWFGHSHWAPKSDPEAVQRLSALSGVDPSSIAGRIESPEDFRQAVIPDLKQAVDSARLTLWYASNTTTFSDTWTSQANYRTAFIRYERLRQWNPAQNAQQSEEVRRRAEDMVQNDINDIWNKRHINN